MADFREQFLGCALTHLHLRAPNRCRPLHKLRHGNIVKTSDRQIPGTEAEAARPLDQADGEHVVAREDRRRAGRLSNDGVKSAGRMFEAVLGLQHCHL